MVSRTLVDIDIVFLFRYVLDASKHEDVLIVAEHRVASSSLRTVLYLNY